MSPDELTNEQKKALLKGAFVMELRVLCTEDQIDELNAAMDNAGKMHGTFIVHHQTTDPTDSDIEEALEFPYEVNWSKL